MFEAPNRKVIGFKKTEQKIKQELPQDFRDISEVIEMRIQDILEQYGIRVSDTYRIAKEFVVESLDERVASYHTVSDTISIDAQEYAMLLQAKSNTQIELQPILDFYKSFIHESLHQLSFNRVYKKTNKMHDLSGVDSITNYKNGGEKKHFSSLNEAITEELTIEIFGYVRGYIVGVYRPDLNPRDIVKGDQGTYVLDRIAYFLLTVFDSIVYDGTLKQLLIQAYFGKNRREYIDRLKILLEEDYVQYQKVEVANQDQLLPIIQVLHSKILENNHNNIEAKLNPTEFKYLQNISQWLLSQK